MEIGNVTELQLATLLFDEQCELCHSQNLAWLDIFLCKRFCTACRKANRVKLSDIDRLYPEFHIAVAEAVPTTFSPDGGNAGSGRERYSTYNHLQVANEQLEYLELLDATHQPLNDEQADEGVAGQGLASTSNVSVSRAGRLRSNCARISCAVDSDTSGEPYKKLKRARQLKAHRGTSARQLGSQMQQEVYESFSPRVREYLATQQDRNDKWKKYARILSALLDDIHKMLGQGRRAAAYAQESAMKERRKTIEAELAQEGFECSLFDGDTFYASDLLSVPSAFTAEEWKRTKGKLKRLAGLSVATRIWKRALDAFRRETIARERAQAVVIAEGRLARLEAGENDASGSCDGSNLDMSNVQRLKKWKVDILVRPKRIPTRVWNYVLPHLRDFASSFSDTVVSRTIKADLSILSAQQMIVKYDYFRNKYQQILDMQSTESRRHSIPQFYRFLYLPTVEQLWSQNPLFAARSDNQTEKDRADKIYEARFDDIVEDIQQYAIDTHVHVISILLSATTNKAPAEIDKLDLVHCLCDAEREKPTAYVDHNFFSRPSSYVICAICKGYLGSLDDVLRHLHDRHNGRPYSYVALPSPKPFFPFELSVQASKALSEMFKLACCSIRKEPTADVVDNAFKGKMLEWRNQPRELGKKSVPAESWREIVCRIHRIVSKTAKSGQILDKPILKLRRKTAREMMQLNS